MITTFFSRIPYNGIAEFEKFSLTHIITVIICILFFIVFFKYSTKLKNWKHEKIVRYCIVAFMLLSNITIYLYIYDNHLPWYMYLPEATCGWSIYFGSIALLTKNRFFTVLSFFWGYGAVFSLLGPNILEGPNRYNFYQFFLRHILIVLTGFYMIRILDFKLFKKDWKLYFFVTLSMAIAGGILSFSVNNPDQLNLFFIMKPGINGTPLSWIYNKSHLAYIIVWLTFASFIGYIYGLPFYEERRKHYE